MTFPALEKVGIHLHENENRKSHDLIEAVFSPRKNLAGGDVMNNEKHPKEVRLWRQRLNMRCGVHHVLAISAPCTRYKC